MLTRSGLVSEDEAAVALFLTDILSDLNYRVCAIVPTGRDAIDPEAARIAEQRGIAPVAALTKPYKPKQIHSVLAGAFARGR
jgi:hypothetical protein